MNSLLYKLRYNHYYANCNKTVLLQEVNVKTRHISETNYVTIQINDILMEINNRKYSGACSEMKLLMHLKTGKFVYIQKHTLEPVKK